MQERDEAHRANLATVLAHGANLATVLAHGANIAAAPPPKQKLFLAGQLPAAGQPASQSASRPPKDWFNWFNLFLLSNNWFS